MTKGQKKLKEKICKLRRLLTKGEAFDLYTEYAMTTSRACIVNWENGKWVNGQKDYVMYEIEAKAAYWHRLSLGSLLLQGELNLWVSDE